MALKTPEVRARFDQLGYALVGDTADQYQAAIRSDSENFGKVIRSPGIRGE